jgi:hypothetical protein
MTNKIKLARLGGRVWHWGNAMEASEHGVYSRRLRLTELGVAFNRVVAVGSLGGARAGV